MSTLLRVSPREEFPEPADPQAAAVGLERWRERALESDGEARQATRWVEDLIASASGRRMLAAVFGNSPFLTECLLAEPPFLQRLLEDGPQATLARLLGEIEQGTPGLDTPDLMARLRIARRRTALTIALADLAGAWPVEEVTQGLSLFADRVLEVTVDHVLRQAHAAGRLQLADPLRPSAGSGFFVLAMGKLGAHELNYSSDIDLIVLYDSALPAYGEIDDLQARFVRATRELVRILEERTAEGYVFRTDLRLRPDPSATPVALSVDAAEVYYESLGQNWERAAMIKARVAAGDKPAGERFLKHLRPFIWRRSLDFAAIQDIHSIKRQIYAHRGGRDISLNGHNLKLGRGGIREIEFFAQTQQLIWGGRDPRLRATATCATLEALVEADRVEAKAAAELIEAYRYLRKVEHRLQMIGDAQTQTLPEDDAGMRQLAVFLGYPDAASFGQALLKNLRTVERHYAHLFEEAPSLSTPGNLVFTGADDDPGTVETLRSLGYRDTSMVCQTVRGWHHGRHRATRSERARQLLTELMPALIGALAKTADPDAAFLRFDEFLSRLPAGVALFSLFHSNPGLLGLIAEIMGAAPRLAEALSRQPARLDAVLSEQLEALQPAAPQLRADLESMLTQARDYEDMLDLSRRWLEDRKFRLGVQVLRGLIDAEAAGPELADLAETVVSVLMPLVAGAFAETHGRVPGADMAVLALGKLGGREMTIASDLDLIFVYDAAVDVESDGPKPLLAGQYFGRLSQRLLAGLSALTAEGRMYEVDMRLRPSGSKGPIASNLEGFVRYHDESAWSWEHLALTRARPIAGPEGLRQAATAVIKDVLTRRRDPDKLIIDVADMRQRMAKEQARPTGTISDWEIKHRSGGLVDVEFIAQYLQLRHAHDHPEVLATNTTVALEKLAEAGLIAKRTAAELIRATGFWRRLQGLLRLTVSGEPEDRTIPDGVKEALALAGGAADFDRLKREMSDVARRVGRHYQRLIEAPAAKLAEKRKSKGATA
ncbi:MAG: bifunctional [glutamine synthetase] adenylyltransferase/[glutamine synthetase]-adenylyl-L-tyrosine phosphorylase [Proteobacteria bacterium]|nr:bifunctional [glutamine synthetase] adenylyltransferase/[glutamine synthetase]-adenylyl-L-tyrosine phosphorylase [Pseudomonadota bacterium]